jgi:hypothetical protein
VRLAGSCGPALVDADTSQGTSILEAAAEFDFFDEKGNLNKRAAKRAQKGFTINLHKSRHAEGRTFKGKGSETKAGFLAQVKDKVLKLKPEAAQRRAVVAIVKTELNEDGQAVRQVIKNDAYFADLKAFGGTDKQQEELRKEIRGRIDSGEAQVKSQHLDSLAD